jgi:non-homologous end joining protein Ku
VPDLMAALEASIASAKKPKKKAAAKPKKKAAAKT